MALSKEQMRIYQQKKRMEIKNKRELDKRKQIEQASLQIVNASNEVTLIEDKVRKPDQMGPKGTLCANTPIDYINTSGNRRFNSFIESVKLTEDDVEDV